MSEILPQYKYLFKKPIDILLSQYKEDILRNAADVWEKEGYNREEIIEKLDELSDKIESAKKPAFIAMYQFYKEKKYQPVTMRDAGAFDIPNSTGLLIPSSQTAPLADFKYFERYDPNQKGHRPNLSQPSKLKNIVPTRENPPFGKADDYQKLNPNMIFDLGTDEFNIRRDRIRGFIEVLSEIKSKIAEENIHGLWAIYNYEVYVLEDAWEHSKWFREIGLPITGRTFDKITRGNYSIANKTLFIEYYTEAGTTDEFEERLDTLIEKIGHKNLYNIIIVNEEYYSRQASILDYPKPGLCPSIWDENGKMLTIIKDQIINKLLKFFKSQDIDLMDKDIVNKIMIIGSLTSYQYTIGNEDNLGSDLDCHIHFSIDKILDSFDLSAEELADLIDDKWRKELNTQSELVKNTYHPLEFYFEMEGFTTAEPTDGVYDLFADKWVKEPRTVDMDFDINEKYPEILEYASNLAKEIDGEIGSIHRDIKDIQLLQETIQAFPKDKQKLFIDKLQNKIDEVEQDIQDIVTKGLKVIKDRHEKYNPYSKENITFKYLQRYLYFDLVKSIKNILVNEKTDKIEVNTIEDIDNVEEIIDEF